MTFRWKVHVRENDDSAIRVETFDGVMVCTGPYRRPKIPQVPGMSQFAGKIMHMHQYRTRDTFARKNVLVVGMFQLNYLHVQWADCHSSFISAQCS